MSLTPKEDILVQGDWNAKVGRDACGNWQGIGGPFCNDDTNERGLRLLEFATCNDLVLVNTFGYHKASRRWSWTWLLHVICHKDADACWSNSFMDLQALPASWIGYLSHDMSSRGQQSGRISHFRQNAAQLTIACWQIPGYPLHKWVRCEVPTYVTKWRIVRVRHDINVCQ